MRILLTLIPINGLCTCNVNSATSLGAQKISSACTAKNHFSQIHLAILVFFCFGYTKTKEKQTYSEPQEFISECKISFQVVACFI